MPKTIREDAKDSGDISGFIEKKYSKDGRADAAGTGPHGIARAYGQSSQGHG